MKMETIIFELDAGYPENPKTVSNMSNHERRHWSGSGTCQKSYQSRGRVGAAFLQYEGGLITIWLIEVKRIL